MPWYQPSTSPPTPYSVEREYDTNNNHHDQDNSYSLQRRIEALLPAHYFTTADDDVDDDRGRRQRQRRNLPSHPSYRSRIDLYDDDENSTRNNNNNNTSFFHISRGIRHPILSPIQTQPHYELSSSSSSVAIAAPSHPPLPPRDDEIIRSQHQTTIDNNSDLSIRETYNYDPPSNENNNITKNNTQPSTTTSPFIDDKIEPCQLFQKSLTPDYYHVPNYQPPPNSHKPSTSNASLRQMKITRDESSNKLSCTRELQRENSNRLSTTSSSSRNWNDVGRVGDVARDNENDRKDAAAAVGVVGVVAKQKKSKTKRRSKLKKKTSNNNTRGDIASMLQQQPKEQSMVNKDDDNDDSDFVPPPLKRHRQTKKQQNRRRIATTTIPPPPPSEQHVNWSDETFTGIEQSQILNAADCDDALDYFLDAYNKNIEYLTWTIVFMDDDCTTSFVPMSKKYCTEKGPVCRFWNCVCDNQVRGMQARAPIFGAMFVFPAAIPSFSQDSHCTSSTPERPSSTADNIRCFILPLGRTYTKGDGDDTTTPEDLPPAFRRFSSWPIIPFNCGIPLQRRWEVFRSILTKKQGGIPVVTFNAVVALLPFHFQKIASAVAADGSTNVVPDLILPSIRDVRLAAWILRPHAAEEELEFEAITAGFPHLEPASPEPPSEASAPLVGLMTASKQLRFLYALYPMIKTQIERRDLDDSFVQIEGPLQSILSAMECEGVGFRPERLLNTMDQLERRIDEIVTEARAIAGDSSFLLSSPQQVAKVLFDTLRLTIPTGLQSKLTAGSQHRSTSTEILETMQSTTPHPIIPLILEHRNLHKLLTTYIRPLPLFARSFISLKTNRSKKKTTGPERTPRIHPTWMQTTVRTGRLSCRRPNMQQLPKNTTYTINNDANTKIIVPRDAFCASSSDRLLFACDYSQNEVRILAHVSDDPVLIALFNREGSVDIYKQMASAVYGKSAELVTGRERGVAKQVTLAVLYGMGVQQVAKKLGVDKGTARGFQMQFYDRFKGVKRWIDQTKSLAHRHGYVTTIVGRRRYLDDIHSNDKAKVAQAERQAVNTIIQGSAADLMKLAMLKMASRIMDWNKEGVNAGGTGVPPKLVLQIHDELLFEVQRNEDDVRRLKDAVLRCCATECESDLRLKVPLKLDCSCGLSWGSAMKDLD